MDFLEADYESIRKIVEDDLQSCLLKVKDNSSSRKIQINVVVHSNVFIVYAT